MSGLRDLNGKRITFFVPEAPPSCAGAGINAYNFARFISSFTGRTTLCHLDYNHCQLRESYIGNLRIARITYYTSNLLMKIISLPNIFARVFYEVRTSDIVLIYSGYFIGFQFIILLAAILGKQVIFRSSLLEGDDADSLLGKNILLRALNTYSLRKINLYFAINPEFSKRFRNRFQNRIPVFESYQGVDRNRFHPVSHREKNELREKLKMNPESKVIVSAGVLSRRKGYEEIVMALSNLPFDFLYCVLGELLPGPFHRLTEKEQSEMAEIRVLGEKVLGQKIKFAGAVTDPENYFNSADIYIQGGKQEGTPNALLEAMACGLTCIVKKPAGLEGQLVVQNKNSLIFERYDELPVIITNLFHSPNLMDELGREASDTIFENYTFEKVADQLFSKLNEETNCH